VESERKQQNIRERNNTTKLNKHTFRTGSFFCITSTPPLFLNFHFFFFFFCSCFLEAPSLALPNKEASWTTTTRPSNPVQKANTNKQTRVNTDTHTERTPTTSHKRRRERPHQRKHGKLTQNRKRSTDRPSSFCSCIQRARRHVSFGFAAAGVARSFCVFCFFSTLHSVVC